MPGKLFRPSHLLWLTVPVAAWCGWRVPAGESFTRAAETANGRARQGIAPSVDTSSFSAGLAAIDRGLEKATVAELRTRFHEALKLTDPRDRQQAIELICARWAEVDPMDGLTYFESMPDVAGDEIRCLLLKDWALINLDAAWVYAGDRSKNLTEGEGSVEKQMVGESLLRENPALALEWMRRDPRQMPTPDAGSTAWQAMARVDPDKLQAFALELAKLLPKEQGPDGWNQSTGTLFTLIGRARAEKDSKGVMAWAAAQEEPWRTQAFKGAISGLAAVSPQAALSGIDEMCKGKPAQWIEEAFRTIGGHDNVNGPNMLTLLGKEDPMIVVELARKYPGIQPLDSLHELFNEAVTSGKMSPLNAYRALVSAEQPNATVASNVLPKIWAGLSADQLREAANVIAKEPDTGARSEAMGGILISLHGREPEAAMKFVGQIGDFDLREAFYLKLQENLPTEIRESRRVEILAQIPTADRAAVFTDTFSQYVSDTQYRPDARKFDGAKFATLLSDLPPSESLTEATTTLATIWGTTNPEQAMAWANGLSDPATKNAGLASGMAGWARHDSNGAAEWLDQQPAGSARDAATVPLVSQLKNSEPDIAWDWAASISDETMRSKARKDAFTAWAVSDPKAAAAALDNATDLPAADLTALRQLLSQP